MDAHVIIIFLDYLSVFISEYSVGFQRSSNILLFLSLLISSFFGSFLSIEVYKRYSHESNMRKASVVTTTHFNDNGYPDEVKKENEFSFGEQDQLTINEGQMGTSDSGYNKGTSLF